MQTGLPRLKRRVREVMRLSLARGVLLAAAAAALAVGGAYLAASVLDIAFWLAPAARAVLLVGALAFAGWTALRAGRGSRPEEGDAARSVEHRFPEIESSLSTAIEYGTDEVKTEAYSSPELVDKLVETTDERTEPLPFRRAVDWKRLARVGAALAGVAIVVLAYVVFLPHMAAVTALRFFRPLGDTPPPTWTVIESVSPGDKEIPRGESVPVKAELGGRLPESVRLLYRGEGEADWLESNMAPEGDGAGDFSRTLARVVRTTEYRVIAGDAESETFRLIPIEEPRVESIRVRVIPPTYTGLVPEDLPEGTGDVRAVEGSEVVVRVGTNRRVAEAALEFELGKKRKKSTASLEAVPPDERREGREGPEGDKNAGLRRAEAASAAQAGRGLASRFKLTESGEYRVRLRDRDGRENSGAVTYRLTAVPDRPPEVKVTHPEREVMAYRGQDVKVRMEASDDYGLAEIGLVHTLRGKPDRVSVQRPKKGTKKSTPEYPMRLILQGFQGGEIVTYYAYAVDSKGTRSKGDLRFVRTFDEDRYGQMPGAMRRRTPRSVRDIEKLIKRQMRVMRKTFELAQDAPAGERAAGRSGSARAAPTGAARSSKAGSDRAKLPEKKVGPFERTARDQDDLKGELESLVRDVEEALARPRLAPGATEGTEGPEGTGGVEPPPRMRPEEIEHLGAAARKMGEASGSLRAREAEAGVGAQSEALAHLSKTRRILLSQNASGDMRNAMESANRRRESERRQRRSRNLDEFQNEMEKLPPMLEREEAAKRRLEQLEDEPPPPAEARSMSDEQRRLAEQARRMADRMSEMRRGDPGMPKEPEKRLLEAAEEMERAAEKVERGRTREAAREAARASEEIKATERSGRQAMRSMDRERMKGASMRAEDLARQQRDLAKQSGQQSTKPGALMRRTKPDGSRTGEQTGAKAGRQEELRKKLAGLQGEMESLSERAARAGRREAQTLRQAERTGAGADEQMESAARMLRGGRPDEARMDQLGAARSLEELAREMAAASREAEGAERQKLADAIRRAEELAKNIKTTRDAARDPASDTRSAASESRELAEESKDLAETTGELPTRGEAGELTQAKESFERAGRRLGRAGEDFDRRDRAGGVENADRALDEATRAAEALRRSAASDVSRNLAAARDAARAAAREQEMAAESSRAAGESGKRETAEKSRTEAARRERDAARAARGSLEQLKSAARGARGLGHELAEWIDSETERGVRERLGERMGRLASRQETPTSDDSGERRAALGQEARESASLAKEARAAAERLESLAAEADDDEIEALRAAGEDAKAASRRFRELDKRVDELRAKEGRSDREGPASREGREGEARELAGKVRDLDRDAKWLRSRIERRAEELLKGEEGRKGRREDIARAEDALRELERRLSRNQPLPRPTNVLRAGALAYQIVGEGLIKKVEALLKQREYRPPEDEEAPEEFRELVERYFRALSED